MVTNVLMRRKSNQSSNGFSLVEMLLVIVVMSSLVIMAAKYMEQQAQTNRVKLAVGQIQMLLNAATSYYQRFDRWPGTVNTWYYTNTSSSSPMQTSTPAFLPNRVLTNPYGHQAYYWHAHYNYLYLSTPANAFQVAFYIGTSTKQAQLGRLVAGQLPFAYYNTNGYVYAYTNIPGSKINNLMSMKFSGVYHHGACIPVPDCPTTSNSGGLAMTAQVFVTPVSVSGVNDNGSSNIYPISSFSAYAIGPSLSPGACANASSSPACTGAGPSGQYWRACLQVITERGDVAVTRTDSGGAAWGQAVSLSAFTRCASSVQPGGSSFSIYGD